MARLRMKGQVRKEGDGPPGLEPSYHLTKPDQARLPKQLNPPLQPNQIMPEASANGADSVASEMLYTTLRMEVSPLVSLSPQMS